MKVMKATIIVCGILVLHAAAQEQPSLDGFANAPTPEHGKAIENAGSSQAQRDSWNAKEDIRRARWEIRYLEDENFEPPSFVDESYLSSLLARKKTKMNRIAKAANLEMPEDLSISGITAFIAEARKRLGPEEPPVDLSQGIGDSAVEAMLKNHDFATLVDFIDKSQDADLGLRTIYAIRDQCSAYSSYMIPLLEKNNPEMVASGESYFSDVLFKQALVKAIAKDLKMEEIENLTHPSVKSFIAEAREDLKKAEPTRPEKGRTSNAQPSQSGSQAWTMKQNGALSDEGSGPARNWPVIAAALAVLFGLLWILLKRRGGS